MFGRGATWIAAVWFFAAFLAAIYARLEILGRVQEMGQGNAALALTLLSIAQLALWALLLLFLARRLGGGVAHTAIGLSLLLWVAYYIVAIMPPGLAQGLLNANWQDRPDLAVPLATGISLFWSCLVFPLPVWLVAAAHSGRELGLRAILAYLVERGTGLWLLFVAYQLVSLFLGLGLNALLGDQAASDADVLVRQAVEALRSVAILLFYVMAYREVRAAVSGVSQTAA